MAQRKVQVPSVASVTFSVCRCDLNLKTLLCHLILEPKNLKGMNGLSVEPLKFVLFLNNVASVFP